MRGRNAPLSSIKTWNSLPSNAMVFFSDGSAIPNPGPSGAGVYFTGKNPHIPCHYSSVSLGVGTNNTAEIYGIKHACSDLFSAFSEAAVPNPLPVYGFIDNKYAIEATDELIRSKTNLGVLAEARSALKDLRSLTSVTLGWIPGHSKLWGNEVADLLAKDGAQGITSRSPPSRATLRRIKGACVFDTQADADQLALSDDDSEGVIEIADDIDLE
jgi:ribonuclease HI